VAIRNLYLSIYLTVVAVLLVFALVVGLTVRHYTESERGRIESAMSDRAVAWGELLEKSLPPDTASAQVQREALLSWADRLGLPLALEDRMGQRTAVSPMFEFAEREATSLELMATRVALRDGRVLWVGRPSFRPGHRHPGDLPGGRSLGGGPVFGPGGPPAQERDDAAGRGERPGGPDGHDNGRPPRGDRGPGWLKLHWLDEIGTLVVVLAALFVAVAAGSYPVVRRLTRRLESLKRGVDTFGAGQLGHRMAVDGRDEVASLAESFNRAAQRVEDLVSSNRSLLANASHELRSPLARLKMAVEMLEITPAERRDDLRQEISRDIRELDALVDEVLLASRLDASAALSVAPVELAGVVAEEASRVGAELELGAGAAELAVNGDERLLRRAVRNLLENARRYGGPQVEAHLHLQGPDMLEIAICDRGPGVPDHFRERIFEPFFRLPGHAERAGGVGLGLSLVRQIAGRHGGQVRCEARDGGGSRFVIQLPVRVPHSG